MRFAQGLTKGLNKRNKKNAATATKRSRLAKALRGRRLIAEPLEDRRLLATITVTTLADVTANDGQVTLREAIQAANTDTSVDGSTAGAGDDTIVFNAGLAGPLALTQNELTITSNITITGNKAANGTNSISVGYTTPPTAAATTRVFNVTAGNFTLNSLIVQNGNVTGTGGAINFGSPAGTTLTVNDTTISGSAASGQGGGIYSNAGNVVVSSSTITGNRTTGANSHGGGISANTGNVTVSNGSVIGATFDSRGNMLTGGNYLFGATTNGGGINATSGTITVTGSTVQNNGAEQFGGGVFSGGGDVTLRESTIRNNNMGGGGTNGAASGGGVAVQGADLTLVGTTISGNRANTGTGNRDGGGIYFQGTAAGDDLTVINSTISGNRAGRDGGGIWSNFPVLISSSTVTRNNAVTRHGGGVYIQDLAANNATLAITNSIIAQNLAATNGPDFVPDKDVAPVVNTSLIGDNKDTLGPGNNLAPTVVGNIIGTNAAPINPMLGPLRNNVGPTFTHAVLTGSPVIDVATSPLAMDILDQNMNSNVTEPIPFEQRGMGFPRAVDGNGDSTATPDMGAVEFLPARTLVVDIATDESDGNFAAGDLSLREAILLSNASSPVDTITFSDALTAGGTTAATINLSVGTTPSQRQLSITDSVTIMGPASTDTNGAPTPKIIIDGQAMSSVFNVSAGATSTTNLQNLQIQNGQTTGTNFIDGGAGIHQSGGTLTVSNSVITGNKTTGSGGVGGGGGIYNFVGTLTLNNTVVTNNTIEGSNPRGGAGVYAFGVRLRSSSIIPRSRATGPPQRIRPVAGSRCNLVRRPASAAARFPAIRRPEPTHRAADLTTPAVVSRWSTRPSPAIGPPEQRPMVAVSSAAVLRSRCIPAR